VVDRWAKASDLGFPKGPEEDDEPQGIVAEAGRSKLRSGGDLGLRLPAVAEGV